jgi:TRAP transporter TAXI family solute receptor
MSMGFSGLMVLEPAKEKKLDLSEVRLMAMGHVMERYWIVRKDSPIKSLSDFRGRKVAVGSPGSGALISSKDHLEAAELTFQDIKPAYLSYTESITGLKDETVDVAGIAAGTPVASILDLARQIPIRFIPYSEKEIEKLCARRPYFLRAVIPAGKYAGVDTNTQTVCNAAALLCQRDIREEIVYKFMKAIYEHPKERDAIHPYARQWNLDNVMRGADYALKFFSFHPGAIKYLKEKKVWKLE